MARIDIKSAGTTLSDGVLQLENGVAMDATLRKVADQNNTTSPLKLSTALVQTTSTLKITTADNPYIDAEDNSGNNRFTIGRDPASQIVNVDFASNPTGSTSQVGAIRTYQDGVNLSDVVKFREDGQVTFTERVNLEADSLVTTQSSSVIAASTTNANLVIAPNGTGALIADIPDGTATGGNARGTNSVDLQTIRTVNNEIAQGNYSNILGGLNNRALRLNSSVLNGSQCQADGEYSVVLNGISNISGGFTNNFTTVINGDRCNASALHSIASGNQSTATGIYSVSLGDRSNATALNSFSYGGIASGQNSFSFRGQSTAFRSYCFGAGIAYLENMFVQGAENFNQSVQISNLISYRTASLTTAGTVVLSLDGTGVTGLIIPNGLDRMWNVQVRWVAVVSAITGTATGVSIGDTKVSTDLLAVAKRSGVTTVGAHTSAGTSVIETTAGSLTTVNITYSAGASQEMAITFTGPTFLGGGSVTMRVVAAISLTEVAY